MHDSKMGYDEFCKLLSGFEPSQHEINADPRLAGPPYILELDVAIDRRLDPPTWDTSPEGVAYYGQPPPTPPQFETEDEDNYSFRNQQYLALFRLVSEYRPGGAAQRVLRSFTNPLLVGTPAQADAPWGEKYGWVCWTSANQDPVYRNPPLMRDNLEESEGRREYEAGHLFNNNVPSIAVRQRAAKNTKILVYNKQKHVWLGCTGFEDIRFDKVYNFFNCKTRFANGCAFLKEMETDDGRLFVQSQARIELRFLTTYAVSDPRFQEIIATTFDETLPRIEYICIPWQKYLELANKARAEIERHRLFNFQNARSPDRWRVSFLSNFLNHIGMGNTAITKPLVPEDTEYGKSDGVWWDTSTRARDAFNAHFHAQRVSVAQAVRNHGAQANGDTSSTREAAFNASGVPGYFSPDFHRLLNESAVEVGDAEGEAATAYADEDMTDEGAAQGYDSDHPTSKAYQIMWMRTLDVTHRTGKVYWYPCAINKGHRLANFQGCDSFDELHDQVWQTFPNGTWIQHIRCRNDPYDPYEGQEED